MEKTLNKTRRSKATLFMKFDHQSRSIFRNFFSGWTLLAKRNNPYKNFDPKEDSAELKLNDPNRSLSETGTFSITIQFMKMENDAVMAELRISNSQVRLSVQSIRYCQEEVENESYVGEDEGEDEDGDELNLTVLLEQVWKLNFKEEDFMVAISNGESLFEEPQFEKCGSDDYDVDDLRQRILSLSLSRIKIDFQASEGISASYRKLQKGKLRFLYLISNTP